MSRNTNKLGFTLLEFLVSIGILSTISVVLVGILYTILIVRSKQQSIEISDTAARTVFTTITNAIESASASPTFASNTLSIIGNPCRLIQFIPTPGILQQAVNPSPGCLPVPAGTLTPSNVQISEFSITNNGNVVIATMGGTYKDSFGSHDFRYQTSVVPRISL